MIWCKLPWGRSYDPAPKMKEIWKDVVGWEGQYQVSSLARVRSFRRYREGRLLKPGLTAGYVSVALGRGNSKLVHRLVAEAFIGPCPKGQEVRHKDGTRTNHRPDNLEYGTRSQNNIDASLIGKRKLKLHQVKLLKRVSLNKERGKEVVKKLAEKYNVSKHCIYNAISGRSWSHVLRD